MNGPIEKETGKMNVPSKPARLRRRFGALAAAVALFGGVLGAAAVAQADYHFEDFDFSSVGASTSTAQAGGHPDFTSSFFFNGNPGKLAPGSGFVNVGDPWARFRNVSVELPPGLTGDPNAFPTCSTAVFAGETSDLFNPLHPHCSFDSIIGSVNPWVTNYGTGIHEPLYNLESPGGDVVARIGFWAVIYPMYIDIKVDPERDDALTATVVNPPTIGQTVGANTTTWGVPTDSTHDSQRFSPIEAFFCGGPCPFPFAGGHGGPEPSGLSPTSFMINPTSCGGPTEVSQIAGSYPQPDATVYRSSPLPANTGCDQVPFDPTLSLQPTTTSAAASSGVDFDLQLPQDGTTNPNGKATADLKKAVITMPEGVGLNASAADGLNGCSTDQIGLDRGERQVVAYDGRGAPVVLSYDGQSTAALPQRSSASAVQAALEALPNIGPGGVAVSGRDGGPWTVDFTGDLAGQNVPQISAHYVGEVQEVGVDADGGTYTLTFDGQTTGSIPFDADGAAIQAALESLPNIDPGDIEVDGSAAPSYSGPGNISSYARIVFTGALGGQNVPQITATASLTGGAGTVVTDTVTEGDTDGLTATRKQGGTLRFNGADPTCPDASKVGFGTIDTPLLPDPLKASLYVARQDDNPYGSLLAGYMVAKGKGVMIKVGGSFDLDPQTGQIVATFDNNPQQPFSDLTLHFKGGDRGVITTPSTCGTYTSDYELTPWSGNAPTTGTSQFTIDQNCGPTQFTPGFSAGSANPIAGAFSTFVLNVTRDAGMAQFTGVSVDPPLGLTGKLAGIPYCPDSVLAAIPTLAGTGAGELASPSCPAASQVGTVVAGAGSGNPFYVKTGKAYLAGPYKGAPLSLAIVTPAVAGPFDLGNVTVRTAIGIDPTTAQLHAVSDPLPTIVQGIPLDLRDVRVILDRQGFALNPTSCAEKAATGTISGTGGASANVTDRFQVGECAALGFGPKLKLSLKGGTKRNGHPAFTSVLSARQQTTRGLIV